MKQGICFLARHLGAMLLALCWTPLLVLAAHAITAEFDKSQDILYPVSIFLYRDGVPTHPGSMFINNAAQLAVTGCQAGVCHAVRHRSVQAASEPAGILLLSAGLLVCVLGRVAGAAPRPGVAPGRTHAPVAA